MMLRFYYLLSLFVATALGWLSWVFVVDHLSPFISGYLALGLFYGSLFIALTGTFAIFGYYLRMMVTTNEPVSRHLNTALRQGGLLSVMVCVGLVFQRLRVLTWWDAFLLLIIVLLIEYYFMSRE